MRTLPNVLLFTALPLLICASCGGSGGGGESELNAPLRTKIAELGLSGDPSLGRSLPEISEPLSQLGLKLFFSKSLGGDFDSACVSCHHPVLGGADALPLSIGVGAIDPDLLGPGRLHPDGDLTVPRNAPTTFNIGLWDAALFWDGRVESLGKTALQNGGDGLGIRTPDSDFAVADPESGPNITAAQTRFPVTSADEMRGFEFVAGGSNSELRTAIEARLGSQDSWGEEFASVFGSPEITYPRIAEAIGAYERSQVFVNTPWRSFVQGADDAINEAAKRGALLFFRSVSEGGFNCAKCHAGDFFTDEQFWKLAAPQIGRGKGDGASGTNDFGRERETGSALDRFAFRTPSLLNISVTGPYFHSGAYDTLADVIRHHLDPKAALASYDPRRAAPAEAADYAANTAEIMAQLESSPEQTIEFFSAPTAANEEQIKDLEEFLLALTDPCVTDRGCLSPWIPDNSTRDPDGNFVQAIGGDGEAL